MKTFSFSASRVLFEHPLTLAAQGEPLIGKLKLYRDYDNSSKQKCTIKLHLFECELKYCLPNITLACYGKYKGYNGYFKYFRPTSVLLTHFPTLLGTSIS